jgi:hypothetical protein
VHRTVTGKRADFERPHGPSRGPNAHRCAALAAALASLGALTACHSDASSPSPIASDGYGRLMFTADGSEIVYVAASGEQTSLKAVRVAGGATRRLDGDAPMGPDRAIASSADGSALYYFAADGSLRNAISGTSVAVGHKPPGFLPGAIAASGDGRRVLYWEEAFTSPGTTTPGVNMLLDVATGLSMQISGCGWWFHLYGLDPNGREAVCIDLLGSGGSAPLVIIDAATGATLRQSDALVSRPADLQWRQSGLQVVGTMEDGTVELTDVSAGVSHVVYRLPAPSPAAVKKDDYPTGIGMLAVTLDPRAAQIGLWQVECRGSDFAEPTYCGPVYAVLIVVDFATGAQRAVASFNTSYNQPGAIAFSDDGAQVAYRVGHDVYLSRLR